MDLTPVDRLGPHTDPRTKDAEKFFLGDRFHEKTVSCVSNLWSWTVLIIQCMS